MEQLHVFPTPTAQWQALIDEAQSTLSLSLGEELESYLVFLLMRFTENTQIGTNPMATSWLESLNQSTQKRHQQLQHVGDECLILSGLFPNLAQKRRVSIGYYVKIGKMAYQTLSIEHDKLSPLFKQLYEDFVCLMDILHITRELDDEQPKT